MDHKHPFYNQFETNKANWAVDYWFKSVPWLRKLGITASALEKHPRIDYVMILLDIRQSLWDRMNKSEQATWGAYWNLVYYKNQTLKDKFWNKFNKIVINIDEREVRQQQQQQHIRQLIRTLKNTDHDNDGKGSNLSQMLTDKGNNRGATMNLLPWE